MRKRPTYEYVVHFGAIYRMTRRNWIRWLKRMADEQPGYPKLVEYGARLVSPVSQNVTDMTPDDAEFRLEGIANTEGQR